MNKSASSVSSPTTQESSVLFSLDEILRLENEKILAEEQQRALAVIAEKERHRAEARHREREAEQRLQDIELARQASALLRREEEARLEGVRLSEIERARYEVENQIRMSLLAQNQAHEQRLLALSQDQAKRRLSRWLMGVVAAVLVFGVAAFYTAKEQRQRTESARIALEQEAQFLRAQISEQQKKIAREMGRHGEVNQALIAKLRADLRHLQAKTEAQAIGGTRLPTFDKPGKSDPKPEKPPEKPCPKGDPMCETL